MATNECVFILTEKPDAAMRIALALDEKGRPMKMIDNGLPYYVATREKKILVVPSLGHLYTITDAEKGKFPSLTFNWVPRYVVERKATRIRTWLESIRKLSKKADVFVDACDYDVEGCVIGYFILRYACEGKEKTAQRMAYSTLTAEELQKSYDERKPTLDFDLIEAGRARHEVDWLYGINLSRCLTNAARRWNGKYVKLSTGRVQGPTLNILVEREEAIRNFTSTPFWQIKAKVENSGQILEASYEKQKLTDLKEAEAVADACKDKVGLVKDIEVERFIEPPPFPFNLSTLQTEAYYQLGYSPQTVMHLAQQLYLKALISYPRTDSQKLPPTINYRKILEGLNKFAKYKNRTSKLLSRAVLKPIEGLKNDPAHTAIFPTGEKPRNGFTSSENRILDLIVRRFMSVFAEPAVKESTKVRISVEGRSFFLNGTKVLHKGWIEWYKPFSGIKELILPLEKGDYVRVKNIAVNSLFTQLPPRYNPATLLRKMEEIGIGTKTTRSEIVQTLHDRGYIRDERIVVTPLGFEIAAILKEYCSSIVSSELTRDLESKMDSIREGKRTREEIITDVVRTLTPILHTFKKEQKRVGEHLTYVIEEMSLKERTVGPCPECHNGNLIVIRSRKTGKRFVGCTNYFKGLCKTSFALPQKGTLLLNGKKCVKCGWPTIRLRTRGCSRILCFNRECPSNKTANTVRNSIMRNKSEKSLRTVT